MPARITMSAERLAMLLDVDLGFCPRLSRPCLCHAFTGRARSAASFSGKLAAGRPRPSTAAVAVRALYIDIGQLSALDEIAEAYGHVDAGTRVRILINIARYRDAPQK